MRVYLDVCCLNRPFDDQGDEKIRLEAEAVALVIRRFRRGGWIWLSSPAVRYEVERTPDSQRRALLSAMIAEIREEIPLSSSVVGHARQLKEVGFHRLDVLHLTFGISGRADVFLTTDDRLMKKARKYVSLLPFPVANPVSWFCEVKRI